MNKPSIDLEKDLWIQGYKRVCGIDEVGRGPLAGPVVAGAVVIGSDDHFLDGVRDSKSMTEKRREYFFDEIKKNCLGWGIGIVESIELDELGISKAIQKAMVLAVGDLEKRMKEKVDFLIVDGNVMKIGGYPMKKIILGDNFHYSISAASVIAKVARDRMMREYAKTYPNYGFEKHVGYGTKVHMDALKKYGPCEIHRKCFKPIAKFFV
jgi:ribonuclease HII